jgi:asparagine synthase (glutamine-hydrolysing)
MEIGYLGGVLGRGGATPDSRPGWHSWYWESDRASAFLHAGGAGSRLIPRRELAVLARGLFAGLHSSADYERLADRLVCHYRQTGELAVDGLEGSFTLALVDGAGGRVLVHRNLVGDSNTYYRATRGGLLLASNLADLAASAGETTRANEDDLATFFLNRTLPGRNTLFAGYRRLMPGEQLELKADRVLLTQRRTLADLIEGKPIRQEAPGRLDETVANILKDCYAQDADAVSLLSGGVDSSFVQAHWARVRPASAARSRSFCVAVDHPKTRGDREYAESASVLLGTRHTVIRADEPYDEYLSDTLRTTGEVPNHVQLAYFPTLARRMAEHGVSSALSGDGADSLFGLSQSPAVQNAALLRRLFPGRLLRRTGAALAGVLRRKRLGGYFRLADVLHDQERLDHPVNRAAVYADWPAVEKCFGPEAVARVAASRRELLDRYRVPPGPLDRLHAAGFLGSAVNTAALTTTMFARAGVRVFTPFLDSRMLRLALNLAPAQRFRFRRPKALLKESLARHGHAELAYRQKLSFGQPIFEWLAPGGPLRHHVEEIGDYPFVAPGVLEAVRRKPTWFLYSLLCYDLWQKQFVRGGQLCRTA